MSLTRVTSTVIASNVLTATQISNSAIQSRHLNDLSVELRHLATSANTVTNLNGLQSNINSVQGNVVAQRTNVNTVSSNVGLVAANTIRNNANIQVAFANVIQLNANINVVTTNLVSAQTVAHSNDFITFTRLNSNIDVVTDNLVSAQTVAHSNDFISFTRLNSNINVVSANADAVEARRAANLASATFTGQVNMNDDLVIAGNLIVSGDTTTANSVNMVVQDRILMLANSATGAPAGDVGILFNRGNQGNAAIFYDESAKTFKVADTKDPSSNTALSPVTLSNLAVGLLSFDGADLNTAITDNVALLDTRANAFDTFTKLDANIDLVQDNVAAVESRRTANIAGAVSTILTSDLTASRALLSSGAGKVAVSDVTSTELGYLDGVTSAIQTQIDSKIATTTSASNDFVTFTRLNANINVVQDNVEARHTQITANLNTTTANINTVSANVEARNTQLNANIDVVQDNVATLGGGGTFFKPFMNVNVALGSSNVFFVGQNTTSDDNVLTVTLDGIVQSNSEFVMHHSNDTIQFKDASIPSGVKVTILSMIGVA